MSTNFKIVRGLAEETGTSPEQAFESVKYIVEYILKRISQPMTQREIVSIVQEPADATPLKRLLAAIAPPFTEADVHVVAEILAQGVDIHIRVAESSTLLHLAVKFNRLEIVRLLLMRGADPTVLDHYQRTPLQLLASITRPNPDIADLLLKAGAQPDLYSACVLGDLSLVEVLLADNPLLAQVHFGRKQETALHVAALHGNVAILQLLLDSGAEVQACNYQAMTALHWAAAHRHLEAAQVLLQHEADPNVQNTFGATPLDLAIKFGRMQSLMVDLLREYGGKQRLETRLIKWEIFLARLKYYYELRDSEVEFSLAEDGSCIETFNVWPKDTPYCIPKVYPHRQADFQDEALATLSTIFFPDESVWIHDISQWETDGDILLEVEVLADGSVEKVPLLVDDEPVPTPP